MLDSGCQMPVGAKRKSRGSGDALCQIPDTRFQILNDDLYAELLEDQESRIRLFTMGKDVVALLLTESCLSFCLSFEADHANFRKMLYLESGINLWASSTHWLYQ